MNEPDRVARMLEQWKRERPEIDPSAMAVIGRMRRLSDTFTGVLMDNYRSYGVGEGEFDVMCALRRAGRPFTLPQGDIAEHTMVTAGATSKRVDRLVGADLASREQQASDARARMVSLTPQGVELIDEMYPRHLEKERELLAPLSSAERGQLEGLLRKLAYGTEGRLGMLPF